MREGAPPEPERVRAAEVISALCLATDLGTGLPFEHGLHSTLVAMRLCDCLGVDSETRFHAYYACLLFYAGCTADADLTAELFPDPAALATHFTPVMFGSRLEMMVGIMRAVSRGPSWDRSARDLPYPVLPRGRCKCFLVRPHRRPIRCEPLWTNTQGLS